MEKTVINSTSNHKMKEVVRLLSKAKERREQGLFVAEGVRMFLETPPARLEKVYVSESFYALEKNRKLLENRGVEAEIVSDRVFESISDTVTPQGILFLARIRSLSEEQLFARRRRDKLKASVEPGTADGREDQGERGTADGREAPGSRKAEKGGRSFTYLLLDGIQDPGNLGTMVRTAEGAGAAAILCSRQTVDLYNPKVIRSTMGSVYRVPLLVSEDLKATVQRMKAEGICVYAAEGKPGAISYDEADFTKDAAILIGNEGNGIAPELAAEADHSIFIPMEGRLESLNASMAAGILMYEAARQKRNHQE